VIFIATKNGSGRNGLVRLMLAGFMAVFAVGALHITLASLGVWQKLPGALTNSIDMATGLILLLELAGHLAILTWKVRLAE
jgi:hypothetical protein